MGKVIEHVIMFGIGFCVVFLPGVAGGLLALALMGAFQ